MHRTVNTVNENLMRLAWFQCAIAISRIPINRSRGGLNGFQIEYNETVMEMIMMTVDPWDHGKWIKTLFLSVNRHNTVDNKKECLSSYQARELSNIPTLNKLDSKN